MARYRYNYGKLKETTMELEKYVMKNFRYNPVSGLLIRTTGKGGQLEGSVAGSMHNGYLRVTIMKKMYLVHRLAFLYMTGSMPEAVDHINGEKDDNRWDNLRSVDHAENMKNMKLNTNNKSGVPGVHWSKRERKWKSGIGSGVNKVNLGTFTKFSEAVDARKNAEVLYGYHTNHGRK